MLTGLELINEVEDRLGWPRTESLESAQVANDTRKLLSMLNRVLKSTQTVDDWPLLRASGSILLVAAVDSTENLTFTNGSTTVTNVTGTEAWNVSMTGMAFQVVGLNTVYRIASVESPTSMTLERAWVDDTAVDEDSAPGAGEEVTYYIAQDSYALPENYDRMVGDVRSFLTTGDLKVVSPRKMAQRRAARNNSIQLTDPDMCTVYGMNFAQQYQLLRVDPWPENAQLITFEYQIEHPEVVTDADKVLFQATQESIVIEALIYLAERDYEDSVQMDTILRDYMTAVNQGISASGATDDIPVLRPENTHRRLQRNKWGRSYPIHSNTIFDTTGRTLR